MKKIISSMFFCALTTLMSGQVSIGGKQSVEGTSTILDFNSPLTASTLGTVNDNTRGIILPAVDNTNNALASDATQNNGTFVFDKSDNKIKVYENDLWKPLTDAGNSTAIMANSSSDTIAEQGAIIGSPTSGAKGVLVLESSSMAMILPRVFRPDLNVKSPYPGMICYDPFSKTIAIYDGNVWNFWK